MQTFTPFAPKYPSTTPTREIAIHSIGHTFMLNTDDITCLEGEGNYTFIYTRRSKRYLVSKTLKSLTEQLDESFIRVHKSYIINTDYIAERLDDERLIRMSCGKEATVSRRKIKEISALLDQYENRVSA